MPWTNAAMREPSANPVSQIHPHPFGLVAEFERHSTQDQAGEHYQDRQVKGGEQATGHEMQRL
jgi:hypothetical protein